MKRIITALLITGLTAAIANADWIADFSDSYKNKGIDDAVEKAIKQGVSPNDIVEKGLLIQTLTPPDLVKALYCAGVTGEDIYNAAQKNSLSELIVTAGFKKSKDECSEKVTDTQPYTPTPSQGRTFGGPNRYQNGRLYASPSTF